MKRLKNDRPEVLRNTRHLQPAKVIGRTVVGLKGLCMGVVLLEDEHYEVLDRTNLDYWIGELRSSEASVRRLRKRLEALRDEVGRLCPVCGRPVIGRADAVYCGSNCRIRAHREARRDDELTPGEVGV